MTLLDYISTLNPNYSRPFHLARLCEALDKIGTEPQRRIFWHAPRCGLTETIAACIVRRPDLSFGYAGNSREATDKRCLGTRIYPADRPVSAMRVSGAIFLDDCAPPAEHLDYLLTRLEWSASLFLFANERSFGESPWAETRKRALELGFKAGWV
jgi:hypothetical protein